MTEQGFQFKNINNLHHFLYPKLINNWPNHKDAWITMFDDIHFLLLLIIHYPLFCADSQSWQRTTTGKTFPFITACFVSAITATGKPWLYLKSITINAHDE